MLIISLDELQLDKKSIKIEVCREATLKFVLTNYPYEEKSLTYNRIQVL
jgi:hypothetical protein